MVVNLFLWLRGVSRLAYTAIDVVLRNGLARESGIPLYEMLGGSKSPKVKAYRRDAIDLNFSLKVLVDDIRRFKEMGFKAFKIEVGKTNFNEDIERIKVVKEVMGSYH